MNLKLHNWQMLLMVGFLLTVICGICRWWYFFSGNTEIVIPVWANVGQDWHLSPGRDKILYRSNGNEVLMDLRTRKKVKLTDCQGLRWLDNTTVQCFRFILNLETLVKTPIKRVNVLETDLNVKLAQADKIYARTSNGTFILILAKKASGENLFISDLDNIDQILKGYDYTEVQRPNYSANKDEKVFSPDQKYYYRFEYNDGHSIAIYDALTNQEISRSRKTTGGQGYKIAGWDSDSTGVYFQTKPTGLMPLFGASGVKKLKAF
ncbi:MAG: hypothetical protein FOGNACKC_05378 [Anaerolineae bacterium]|nr:hypothetical protein [Anaerolineae bacterium]